MIFWAPWKAVESDIPRLTVQVAGGSGGRPQRYSDGGGGRA